VFRLLVSVLFFWNVIVAADNGIYLMLCHSYIAFLSPFPPLSLVFLSFFPKYTFDLCPKTIFHQVFYFIKILLHLGLCMYIFMYMTNNQRVLNFRNTDIYIYKVVTTLNTLAQH